MDKEPCDGVDSKGSRIPDSLENLGVVLQIRVYASAQGRELQRALQGSKAEEKAHAGKEDIRYARPGGYGAQKKLLHLSRVPVPTCSVHPGLSMFVAQGAGKRRFALL